MPNMTTILTNLGNVFMIDVFALLSIDCIQRISFYDKLYFFVGVPVMCLLLMIMGVQLVKNVFVKIPLEDFKTFINIYFTKIINLVTSFGGEVVKFAGDALYAIWTTDGCRCTMRCTKHVTGNSRFGNISTHE